MKKPDLKNYWKSAILTSIILYLSFFRPPRVEPIEQIQFIDKWIHMAMYIVFSMSLMIEFVRKNGRQIQSRRFYLICLLFPFLMGGIIEIVQTNFFPPRTAEWLDWVSDGLGILIGWFIFSVFLKLKQEKK